MSIMVHKYMNVVIVKKNGFKNIENINNYDTKRKI
jgi:hypothetical protein